MQSSCSGPPISGHDHGGRLFSDKFVRQRSVPASGGAVTYPFIETKSRPQATSSINRTCTSQIVSRRSPGCTTKSGSSATTLSNGKQCKKPSTIANSSGSSRARPNVSQLRQQSLPSSLTKSKSTKLSTSSTTASSQQSGSSLHKAAARQNQKLMSGPSLTSLHLARRDQQKWQQSIPSKSSPKQPLLDKRLGITSQKYVRERNSTAHQRKISHGDSPLHSHGAHRSSSASEKIACGSEIEITQVQFDLDKLPKVESGSRKSSISTLGSGSAEFEEASLFPDSNCQCRECRDAAKLQPKLRRRSIEVHLPTTSTSLSAADSAKKSKCIPPAPSTEKYYEEKKHRCSKSEERQTRSRRSLNHNHRACGVRREVSRIRKTSSLSTASDDGKFT